MGVVTLVCACVCMCACVGRGLAGGAAGHQVAVVGAGVLSADAGPGTPGEVLCVRSSSSFLSEDPRIHCTQDSFPSYSDCGTAAVRFGVSLSLLVSLAPLWNPRVQPDGCVPTRGFSLLGGDSSTQILRDFDPLERGPGRSQCTAMVEPPASFCPAFLLPLKC